MTGDLDLGRTSTEEREGRFPRDRGVCLRGRTHKGFLTGRLGVGTGGAALPIACWVDVAASLAVLVAAAGASEMVVLATASGPPPVWGSTSLMGSATTTSDAEGSAPAVTVLLS